MTLNMEEKNLLWKHNGPKKKNLWSENCLKKQVDVERLTLNMEEKKNELCVNTTLGLKNLWS